MISRIVFSLSMISLLLFFPDAHAQQTDDQEATEPAPAEDTPETPLPLVSEEVIVTATRLESAMDTVGSSATVIDRLEIEERRKTSVLELLRTVPGLEIARNGGPGTTTSAFLRGAASAHTLILVDGVRANSVNSGSFDFSNIRPDNVERIEIVRGPQSTLYGSEAIGGVINIISRQGEPGFRSTLTAEAGSHDFLNGRLSVNGASERVDYSASVAYESTDGVSAASERTGNTEDDGFKNFTASGRLGFEILSDGKADLTVRYTDSETELDGFTPGVGTTDDLNYVSTRESLFASLNVRKPVTSWWTQTFILSLSDDAFHGDDPDTVFNNFDIDGRISELTLMADLTPSDENILTLGYSIEQRKGSNEGNFDEKAYLRSFFLQDQWSWRSRLFLTVGVRNDDHSEFGDETTYRGTLACLLAGGKTRVHGSYGTGFRAPSFNELYFPFFGFPDLRPESSEGFDLGIQQRLHGGDVILDLTYFDNQFDDLIAFDVSTFLANNILKANSHGFELSLRIAPTHRFAIDSSYTYTDSEDEATGDLLPRRPRNRSTVAFEFSPFERLRGILTFLAVKDRIDSDGSALDDYERIDLSVSYSTSRRFTPYIRVENLFDEDYEEVNGFTTPGITAALGFNLQL